MEIRAVNKNEYDIIYELVRTAFLTAQVSDGNEQDFVLELRKRAGYIPELELIGIKNDEIIAHVMLTKQAVHETKGETYGLLVAPLCVKEEYRNQYVGTKLMIEAGKRAKAKGYTSLFLIGNPEYYERLGFKKTTDYGIENRSEIPDEYVMACELVEGALENIGGYVILE